MFADFFIKRPVFSTVTSLVIVIAGAVCIPVLPIAQFPELAPPTIEVSSFYVGANAQAVETSVTTILEEAINGVEGMRYMTSISSNDGVSQVSVVFELTRPLDIAAVDVQNRVSGVMGRLPNEVKNTGVTVNKVATSFIGAVGFYSSDNRYSTQFMSNYVDIYVKNALKRIHGVADVQIFGERKYSMRLWLDPSRLAARGLTASDVVSALQQQNVQIAAGQVGQEPAPKDQMFQISVRAAGRLTDAAQFDDIVLKPGGNGAQVRLKDVGRAELGAESYAGKLRFNGYEGVGIGISQLPTANALDVDKAVKQELARLSQRFPPGMKYAMAFDSTTFVGDSIREVLKTLVEAILFVMIVMFLFLQDWRTTLIPAFTIPVSLVGAFAFIKLLGFSINTLTLFGIVLATGLVVDDAIVVIENIQRHMGEEHVDSHFAASEAMGEVTGAVVATSLVLVAVFVPVAFFPGTTGLLYQQFSLTIAFSIAISAFNSLTFTPSLSALLLRPERSHEEKNIVFRGIETAIKKGTAMYTASARRAIHFRYLVLVAFFLGLGATYVVYKRVPTGFVPDEDQGWFMVLVLGPPGASLEYTADAMRQVEAVLAREKDITGAFTVAGFSFTGSSANRGMIFLNLADNRKGEQHAAAAVVNRLRGPLSQISDIQAFPFLPPAISGVAAFGGFSFQVLEEGGGSLQELYDATQKVAAAGNSRPDLRGLFSSYTANDPQFLVKIDREKARSMQIPLQQITDTLQVYMGSAYVNDFDFNNRAYRVYVQASQEFRRLPRDIRSFYVRSDTGTMVPLDNVVDIRETISPQVITHFNLFRSAEIDGSAAPGYSSGQAITAMDEVAKQNLPIGFNYAWSGLSLEEIRSGSQSLILFGLGLLFVYLTLSAQYESFVLPFIILLSVPMALLGALIAQSARGLLNDVYCQIGMVMLIGLASKNGILIVEFAEQLRHKGLPIVDAAVQAARIRLRPILMTSFAFILGVLPLVFATGAGSASRNSVGTTVFGGMIVSTALNLFFIPVLYVIVKSLLERNRPAPESAPLP
ncbi:MAG TPA: multidrug efflux RND transporter permease subunit [Candidatus Eisenbacteria bacterium]|nr:multidrug efflux RND transporter permease subunit [Candidatus Eisenbacteria bacterium]